MELKEGMYVRSKINGIIAKITGTEILCVRNPAIEAPYTKDIRYILDNNLNKGFCESEKDSVKASYNIIDLIEVGDYVNGYKVEEVNNNLNEHKGTCNCLDTYLWCVNDLGKFEEMVIFENDIKSIVTKEQFESMQYRLGD